MERKDAYEVVMETYEKQQEDPNCWVLGKAITAQYTDEAILVYQAFEPAIGRYAVKNQTFKGDFKCTFILTFFSRLSFVLHRQNDLDKDQLHLDDVQK